MLTIKLVRHGAVITVGARTVLGDGPFVSGRWTVTGLRLRDRES
jgi:hypothetical protein